MNVKELKELLNTFDDNDILVMSKASLSNNFSPLAECSQHIYVPDSTYSGEIYIRELTLELKESGYTDEDLYHGDNGQKTIVLWPTN